MNGLTPLKFEEPVTMTYSKLNSTAPKVWSSQSR
jgi:hypothetical protein